MKINLLLPFMLLVAGPALAQTTLQVVTQTVQKSVAWKPGYSVEINGEKAEVIVEPGSGTSVTARAELTAKHPKLDSAQVDVKAWKFVVSTVGKKIYIRAYIGVAAGRPLPVSNLKARITVQIPAACPVNLRNKFGQAKLDRLDGPIALSGEFCTFTLTNLSGKIDVDSRYGDVEGRNLNGPVAVQSKRADVTLTEMKGDCRVNSEYGRIQLGAGPGSGNLTVEATKSDVVLNVPDRPRHSFDLKAEYGQLQVSPGLPFSASAGTQALSWQEGQNRPKIKVFTSFGKIFVQ